MKRILVLHGNDNVIFLSETGEECAYGITALLCKLAKAHSEDIQLHAIFLEDMIEDPSVPDEIVTFMRRYLSCSDPARFSEYAFNSMWTFSTDLEEI